MDILLDPTITSYSATKVFGSGLNYDDVDDFYVSLGGGNGKNVAIIFDRKLDWYLIGGEELGKAILTFLGKKPYSFTPEQRAGVVDTLRALMLEKVREYVNQHPNQFMPLLEAVRKVGEGDGARAKAQAARGHYQALLRELEL